MRPIYCAVIAICLVACDSRRPAQNAPETATSDVVPEAEATTDAGWPVRTGERPDTSNAPDGTRIAHEQKTQNAPAHLQEALLDRVRTLPGIRIGRSYVSVEGARAFHLDPQLAVGPREAFAARQEFGHLHPPYDGSLHLNPPPDLRAEIIEKGWAELHPRSSRTVMVYGPRDEAELEVVWGIVQACYQRAAGLDQN